MNFNFNYNGVPIIITNAITKTVQARTHKKKRINKKWLKRYGYKEIQNENKTYMIDGKLYIMTQRCYNKMKKILEKENKINNCEVEING